jgi:hypothetical protein
MANILSDNVIILLIIIIILIFIKGVYYLLYVLLFYFGLHEDKEEDKSIIEKFYDVLDIKLLYISDFLDTMFLFISSYILFFRKHNSIIIIILCFMFILKFILHFFLIRRFETYFGIEDILSDETIEKLLPIKSVNSFITNTLALIAAGYALKIIFYNK